MNQSNTNLSKSLVAKVDYYWSSVTMAYADWRSGATRPEKRCYNSTDSILLSFDDYADQDVLRKILAILKKNHVTAIFFFIGSWADENPKLLEAVRAQGHWLGNHTATHQNLTKLSDAAIRLQIAGGVTSSLLRPPYGAYDARIRKIALDMDYKIANWTIDSEDWKGLSVEQIQARVFRSLQPGACILMHLNAQHTIAALPDVLQGIRERGYELCAKGDELEI